MRPIHACIAAFLMLAATSTFATERSHTSTVKVVYPMSNGDFVIIFDSDPSTCTSGNVPKYFYVAVGQNGMTSAGASKLYAAAMAALLSGGSTSIHFDDATSFCYVNRMSVYN